MWFSPSSHGNTVVWRYINYPRESAVTWSGNEAPTSVLSTVTSVVTTSITSKKSHTTTYHASPPSSSTSTSTQSPVATSAGNKLTPGASAGIGVGVAIGVLLIAGALLLLWRNKRKVRESAWNYPPQYPPPAHEKPTGFQEQSEMHQSPPVRDMGFGGEVQGTQVLPPELASSNARAHR